MSYIFSKLSTCKENDIKETANEYENLIVVFPLDLLTLGLFRLVMFGERFWNIKRIAFVFLFAIVGFIALHINLFRYEGLTGKFFTWFEFIGPQAGIFLGPAVGFIATFGARVINFVFLGQALEATTIIPLFTLAFAALYFGTDFKGKMGRYTLAIPILAIITFLAHPVGREVWYFTLFWLIPIIMSFSNRLFAKSLGATFTAHSVGGALWIWSVPFAQDPAFWQGLLLVVPIERLVYAIGISIGFIVFTTVLDKAESIVKTGVINIDKRYVIGKGSVKTQ